MMTQKMKDLHKGDSDDDSDVDSEDQKEQNGSDNSGDDSEDENECGDRVLFNVNDCINVVLNQFFINQSSVGRLVSLVCAYVAAVFSPLLIIYINLG